MSIHYRSRQSRAHTHTHLVALCSKNVLPELPHRGRRLSACAMHLPAIRLSADNLGSCQLFLIAVLFIVFCELMLKCNTELWILCRFLYTWLWDAIVCTQHLLCLWKKIFLSDRSAFCYITSIFNKGFTKICSLMLTTTLRLVQMGEGEFLGHCPYLFFTKHRKTPIKTYWKCPKHEDNLRSGEKKQSILFFFAMRNLLVTAATHQQ